MICIVDDIALRYPFAFFIELFLVLWKSPCVLVLVKWWYPPGTQSCSQVFCRVHPEFWQTEKKVLNFEGPFPGLEKVWKNGQSLSGSGESLNFFKIINFSHFRQAGKRDCNRKYFCGKNRRKSVTNVDVGRESIVVLLYHWWVVTRCFQIKEGD